MAKKYFTFYLYIQKWLAARAMPGTTQGARYDPPNSKVGPTMARS